MGGWTRTILRAIQTKNKWKAGALTPHLIFPTLRDEPQTLSGCGNGPGGVSEVGDTHPGPGPLVTVGSALTGSALARRRRAWATSGARLVLRQQMNSPEERRSGERAQRHWSPVAVCRPGPTPGTLPADTRGAPAAGRVGGVSLGPGRVWEGRVGSGLGLVTGLSQPLLQGPRCGDVPDKEVRLPPSPQPRQEGNHLT